MKKAKKVILAAGFFILAACGRPEGMDEQTYKLGQRAVKIIDEYNKASITKADCIEKLDTIKASLDGLELEEEYASKNLTVEIYVDAYVEKLSKDADTSQNEKKLRDILE